MKITGIGLYANNVETMRFELRSESANSRYLVRQISGLDADEIAPRFYGRGNVSDQPFYEFSMKPKELVIRVKLNPIFSLNEEHADVRDEIYKAISATRMGLVNLRFYSGGGVIAQLYGFITKLEAGYFNKEPEAQLTIRCDDPLYRSMNPTRLENVPVVNPFVLADSQSTAPHGFTACLNFVSNTPEFQITEQETDPDWFFRVVPNGGFLIGDKLYFSSDYANKYLYMDRGGTITHLGDKIWTGSVWPTIFPGFNSIWFVNPTTFEIEFVEFYSAYWGV